MRYVVDTHALIWHLTDDPRLGSEAKAVLVDDNSLLLLPMIVMAEAKYIADRKRTPISFSEIVGTIITDRRCTVYPLDVLTVLYLPKDLNIHDSLIVATTLLCADVFREEIRLITKDEEIKRSGLVITVW